MNKKNNKGFSLVELIVVVAIMAVLVGVLAPAYLKYVEQSREKKDLNNLEEVRHAVEIALADEDIYTQVAATTDPAVSIDADGALTANSDLLQAEVQEVCGTTITLVSDAYGGAHTITITITNGVVEVEGDWGAQS